MPRISFLNKEGRGRWSGLSEAVVEQLSLALPFAPNLWELRPGMPGGGGAGALLGGAGAVLSISHSCVGQVGMLPTHLQPGKRGPEGSLTPFLCNLGNMTWDSHGRRLCLQA